MDDLICHESIDDIMDDDMLVIWNLFTQWIFEDYVMS